MSYSEADLARLLGNGGARIKGERPPALPAPARPTAPGVIRQSRSGPNTTEARFERDYLSGMLASGEISAYRYEAITLRLANGARYTPDWSAWIASGKLVCWEIKGARPRQREAGILALKVAATAWPEIEFWLARWDGTTWTTQRVRGEEEKWAQKRQDKA